jgi:hypothetical protein
MDRLARIMELMGQRDQRHCRESCLYLYPDGSGRYGTAHPLGGIKTVVFNFDTPDELISWLTKYAGE